MPKKEVYVYLLICCPHVLWLIRIDFILCCTVLDHSRYICRRINWIERIYLLFEGEKADFMSIDWSNWCSKWKECQTFSHIYGIFFNCRLNQNSKTSSRFNSITIRTYSVNASPPSIVDKIINLFIQTKRYFSTQWWAKYLCSTQ